MWATRAARLSEHGGNALVTRKDKEMSASRHPVFAIGKIKFVLCMHQRLIFTGVSKTIDYRASVRQNPKAGHVFLEAC